jgi:hypothetical protein
MIAGYALKWVGLLAIIIGLMLLAASFASPGPGAYAAVAGIVFLLGGGFCRYVSKQTVRTTK